MAASRCSPPRWQILLLKTLFTDAGDQGRQFQLAPAELLPCSQAQIINALVRPRDWFTCQNARSWRAAIGSLNRCRRLGLAFLRLASIRLMLGKPLQSTRCFRIDS